MYGHAISSTAVWLRPERALIFAKRVTLRYGNIETITHPSDSLYSRKAYAQIRKDVSRPLFVTSSDYANRVLDLKAPLSTAIAAFNTATGTTATYGIGNVGGTHIARAQSFNLATYTSRLQSVAIEFGANVGTPYGTMSLHLMSVNAQSASAGPNAILWKSLPFTPVASSVNTITFNDSPILQPGYYAWALVPDNLQLSGNYWQIKGTASDTYASGISATQSDTGGWITGVGIDYWSTITTANIRGRDASAQSFSLAATSDLYSARIKLGKMGSPTGILTLKIYSDVSSSPGSELASSLPVSLANITIPNIGDVTVPRSEWVNFIFPTPYSLVASTTYWIVLETSSSASSTDWVGILASSLSPTYAGGSVKYLQSTWKSESGDWILELYESADPSIPQAVSVGAWWANDAPLSVKFDATTNTTFRSNIEESSDITLYVEL
jgi:hypothetical protein